jgi:hypothetical protein
MATINGTSNGDTKYGTTGIDTINGLGGNDSLYGRAGNDTISGGTGADRIWGETGNDILRGDDGDDFVYGGDGNDVVYGGIGNDSLYGDAGTDTLKGDAGNDIIKGGTGISYLYGGDGNDTLHYDPSTDNIAKIGNYLSGSQLNGDAGTDTLNIYNRTTYTSGTTQKAAHTFVGVDEYGKGSIRFVDGANPYGNYDTAGTFKGIEKIVVSGAGGMTFFGPWESYTGGPGLDITGTAVADTFRSAYMADTMRGGGGNDTFYFGDGNDKVFSETNDADIFQINTYDYGNKTITGFNGAGAYGGDRIYIANDYQGTPDPIITQSNGKTTISVSWYEPGEGSPHATYTIDKVGLVEGVDYFFV